MRETETAIFRLKLLRALPFLWALAVLCFEPSAWAVPRQVATETHAPPHLFVGFGAMSTNLGRVTMDPSGKGSLVNSTYADLLVSWREPIAASWSVAPTFTFTPFGLSTFDNAATRRMFLLTSPFQYTVSRPDANQAIDLRAGLGIAFYVLSGHGGESVQSNGLSTSKFYLPSSSSTSRFLLLDVGGGYQIDRYRLDLGAFITGFASSRFAVNMTAQLGVGIQ